MENKPVVAIVGTGFGGMNAAKDLRTAPVKVVLIDQHNYHLFQPLLYQVATGAVAPVDIAYPVRAIFQQQRNFEFELANIKRVDLEGRRLIYDEGEIPYDYLILSPGGETNYFGLESIQKYGFTLKDLQDAEHIRNHILSTLERATQVEDEEECRALRTFVVVGGGPTGVECAGALSEVMRLALFRDFPELGMDQTRVILLEAMGSLLAGFPPELAQAAADTLERKHVEVWCNAAMKDYDGRTVLLKDGRVIHAYTLIWAAGVRASSLLNTMNVRQARQGRVVVEPTLQVPGHPEVFIIGDAAYLEEKGQPLPMMAPVAIQQAKIATENIRRMISGKPLVEFKYKDPGSLATIGRNAAVARIKTFKFSGFVAWLVWLAVHLFWLIGFRNRLFVMINWALDYFFHDRAVRLITEDNQQQEKKAVSLYSEGQQQSR